MLSLLKYIYMMIILTDHNAAKQENDGFTRVSLFYL